MRPLSPLERPDNLDRVESILRNLASLNYLGPYIDFWYTYREVTNEILQRHNFYRNLNEFGPHLPEPYMSDDGRYKHRLIGRPEEMIQLLTSPYPVQIEVYFKPGNWKDGKEIDEHCRLLHTYRMRYWIRLNCEENEYYISKEPWGEEVLGTGSGVIPAMRLKDGYLPVSCIDHYPYVETCAPRFREIIRIFDEADLPRNIEELPSWSQLLKEYHSE